MNSANFQSVKDKFAQLDQDAFALLKTLGYGPQIIFDVGASDGSWSKAIVKVLPSAEYHLFEPLIPYSPAYQTIIFDNLGKNPNFHLHELALGEKKGEVTINIFPNFFASTILDIDGSGLEFKPAKVSMNAIDELIETGQVPLPQVIKIDTQGYELAILKGAVNTLPNVDILLLECWLYRGYGKHTPLLTEIVSWLHQYNFRLWDVGDAYRGEDDVLAALDCIFVNTNSGIVPTWYYDK